MKNVRTGILLFFLMIAAIAVFSCKNFNSVVKGTASPPDGALRAWLYSKTDTLNTDVNQGNFEFHNVKPGQYTMMVEGKPPYRNSTREGVDVVEGQPTDVGDINMSQ